MRTGLVFAVAAATLLCPNHQVFTQQVSTHQVFTQTWLSATLDNASASQILTRHTQYTAASWTHCMAMGAALRWPQLVCYTRPTCTLWSGRYVLLSSVRKNGTNSGPCKVQLDFTGCFRADFTLAGINDTRTNSLCWNLKDICEDGGFVFKPPFLETVCESPYELRDQEGCVYIEWSQSTWCDGRQVCLDSGGDLYSVASEQEYQSFIAMLEPYTGMNLWAGLWYLDHKWSWLHSNFTPAPEVWASPPEVTKPVAMIKVAQTVMLESVALTDEAMVVCRRWIP